MAETLDTKNLDFQFLMEHQKTISKNLKMKNEKVFEYDFKIVSFKIGNENYGIDIMSVKEILKAKKFTRVPNAFDFVEGILNLRGDILPVINLAKMFHLNDNSANSELKSIIIIKVETLLIGLVVDEIHHVVPLREIDLQPPSPLLGSINEKYIQGVINVETKLYVVLDTDAIFSDKEKAKKDVISNPLEVSEEIFLHFCNQIEEFSSIHINKYNRNEFRQNFSKYITGKDFKQLQNIDKETSNLILDQFISRNSDEFWDQTYSNLFTKHVISLLKQSFSDELRVLNLGCGAGYETLSIFFLLDKEFPETNISIVAADVDLVSITNASGFEIEKQKIPAWVNKDKYFMKISDNYYKIKKEINDKIYFEFHDVNNIKTFTKEFDLVIARDLSLYLSEVQYQNFIINLSKKISDNGIIIVGDNEQLKDFAEIKSIDSEILSIYKKI